MIRLDRTRVLLVSTSVALSAATAFAWGAEPRPEIPARDSLFRYALVVVHTQTSGNWQSLCVEDGRPELDSLFTRVKQGDRLFIPDWVAPFGEFQVLDVTEEGGVLLALPEGVVVEDEPAGPERGLTRLTHAAVTVVQRPVPNDAYAILQFCVLDSLPAGARLDSWAPPGRESAWSKTLPVVVRSIPPPLPFAYHGPWGTVCLTVELDEAAKVVRTRVARSVSPRLDAAAEAVVRRWKYRLNPPCPGMWPQRSLAVEVPFPRPRR